MNLRLQFDTQDINWNLVIALLQKVGLAYQEWLYLPTLKECKKMDLQNKNSEQRKTTNR